jgi:hypothetical protein
VSESLLKSTSVHSRQMEIRNMVQNPCSPIAFEAGQEFSAEKIALSMSATPPGGLTDSLTLGSRRSIDLPAVHEFKIPLYWGQGRNSTQSMG